MSSPKWKVLLSHPPDVIGRTASSAHCGNWAFTMRRTSASSMGGGSPSIFESLIAIDQCGLLVATDLRSNAKPQPHSAHHPADSFEPWFCARGERFVQAFTPKSARCGNGCDSMPASDIAERLEKIVVLLFLERHAQIGGDCLFVSLVRMLAHDRTVS